MSITILATPARDGFELSGDISRSLPMPSAPNRALAISLSDGTLIEATLSGCPEVHFKVAKEGSAITIIEADAIQVEWPIEWLTVAGLDHPIAIDRDPEPMPLFPGAP